MPSQNLLPATSPLKIKTLYSAASSDSGMRQSIALFATTISASELEKEITNRIDLISKELLKTANDNIYQYALEFDLEKEKLKLNAFLTSDFMQHNFKFWDETVGIYYNNESEKILPKNKVCVNIICDDKHLPYFFTVSYKGDLEESRFEMNLLDLAKRVDIIKKNKLTYLDNISELIRDVESIADRLRLISNQERILIMTEFNQKWANQLMMTYTVDLTKRTGTCKVEDKSGMIILKNNSNQIKMEPFTEDSTILLIEHENQTNDSQLISNSPLSFWKRNISCTAVTALTLGVATAALLYSMNKI